MKFKTFLFEGPIGAGKTTALNFARDYFAQRDIFTIVVEEPVDEWIECKNLAGKSWLALNYENPSCAFTLHLMCQFSRLAKIAEAVRRAEQMFEKYQVLPLILMERSPESGVCVFGEMHVLQGNMSKEEADFVANTCKKFEWQSKLDIATLNIKVPVTTCLQRISSRGRREEETIDEQFMTMLNGFYESSLNACFVIRSDTKELLVQDLNSIFEDQSIWKRD